MRQFQRHQLSKKHAAAVATPVNVFEKILKDFRAGKAVPSGLQFPSEGANNEVLRAASTARRNSLAPSMFLKGRLLVRRQCDEALQPLRGAQSLV